MEDEIYETDGDYSHEQITRVEQWFDRNIGTDTDINNCDDTYYLMCYDMTPSEVTKATAFELRFREGMSDAK